jgi:hypothetical protein
MKTYSNNDIINYSLQNIENYKKNIDCHFSEIIKKYSYIIIEYLKYIMKTIQFKKNKIIKFIILRGLNTITHVFKYILYYTKNLNITFYQCEKAFYFYVEFVSQISEDDKAFLQLSSRDATNYVYKKTIFEINYQANKNIIIESLESKMKLDLLNIYINLYSKLIEKIIENDLFYTHDYGIFIETIEIIIHSLNSSNLNLQQITMLESIVDNLSYKISNIKVFFDIILQLIKKIIKEPTILEIINDKLTNITLNFTKIDIDEITKNPKKFITFITIE